MLVAAEGRSPEVCATDGGGTLQRDRLATGPPLTVRRSATDSSTATVRAFAHYCKLTMRGLNILPRAPKIWLPIPIVEVPSEVAAWAAATAVAPLSRFR